MDTQRSEFSTLRAGVGHITFTHIQKFSCGLATSERSYARGPQLLEELGMISTEADRETIIGSQIGATATL
ncbi:MAG: hypothetical protein NVSMB52_15560 [Chloroflexota bacterium]